MVCTKITNLLPKTVLVSALFLTGCLSNNSLLSLDNQDNVQNLSVSRQKQRITLLQKKLQIAQKDLQEAQEQVIVLSKELQASQLALISRQIESYEQQVEKIHGLSFRNGFKLSQDPNGLFIKEREMLEEMMESGPSPESSQAQIVLDKVLRLITESQDIETGQF